MSKKNILQIFIVMLASLVFGLGSNFLSRTPLPLFTPFENTAMVEGQVHFAEVDVDFVRQLGADPGAVLIDARFPELFAQGHIPGAISLPLSRFDEDFASLQEQLRAARLRIVYCSGWTCNDSIDLARRLHDKGFKDLLLYRGGMEDWQEKGNAVAR